MAVQGFFSPEKKRMAGEKENKPFFSVEVKPVTLANNINKYNEQTPSLDYAPDRVEQYIKESETKSYKPEEKDSYVSADSYKPDVKTDDQMFGEGYKKQEEKRTQFYNAVRKDLNVGSYGEAKLAPGIQRTYNPNYIFRDNYTYLKDGKLVTRKEQKEIEKDMALRTQLGKFVRDRESKEMSALRDAEYASYKKNMPDPDDRKIDALTAWESKVLNPSEKIKPFEQRKFDYQRENIRYGTAEDGTPTATISGNIGKYGEDAAKVYGMEQLKKFIAADAKDKYESEYRRDFGPDNLGKPMKSNFVGGVSGLGKESDDFTSRYESTAGDFDRKKMAEFGIDQFSYKTFPHIYKERKIPGVDPTNPNYWGDDFVSPAFRRNYAQEQADREAKQFGTGIPSGSDLPAGSFGISEIGKDVAKYNRYEKSRLDESKKEQENKNILQKVGDAVGNVFNKLTGTVAADAGTLKAQGINTSATTNISQMGNVDPVTQLARDAVAKANLRKSGLDRTVGGKSSQANYGSGRTGGFGTGTHGKGMPSNPGSQRQTGVGKSAGNLSRHKAGPSAGRGGVSRSTSRGQGGGTSSRSRGGTGTGSSRSNTGSKSSARGARGSAGSRGRGGTGSGGTSTSRSASKASRSRTGRSRTRCDIRTKIDISPLINSNLVRDNLAELAYFVQEIKK